MTLGDLLELLGIACAAAAAWIYAGLPAGLLIIAVGLIYEGQCYGKTNLPSNPLAGRWAKVKAWSAKPVIKPVKTDPQE